MYNNQDLEEIYDLLKTEWFTINELILQLKDTDKKRFWKLSHNGAKGILERFLRRNRVEKLVCGVKLKTVMWRKKCLQ